MVKWNRNNLFYLKCIDSRIKFDISPYENTSSPFFKGGWGDLLILHYNQHNRNKARRFRINMIDTERKLWPVIRRKQLCGYQFLTL
ncbi:DUF559 domain-containing protein [bacterium]|nr:DUF559 domain-containing protein [bacterium]